VASIGHYPRIVHMVLAVHGSVRCSCLVNGMQVLLIRMAAILKLAHSLFCELCSQLECPCVVARGCCFLPLPVLGFDL
jgi:hypothetical protein